MSGSDADLRLCRVRGISRFGCRTGWGDADRLNKSGREDEADWWLVEGRTEEATLGEGRLSDKLGELAMDWGAVGGRARTSPAESGA